MAEPARRRVALLGVGLLVGLALLLLGGGGWLDAGTSGVLRWLGWVVPGGLVALVLPARVWRPTHGDLVRGGVAALLPAVLVTLGVAGACAVGAARWDPGGAGLAASWTGNEAGAMAFAISAPHTVGLLQAGMILGAPVWALPQGLGVALWARALPLWARIGAVCGLMAVGLGIELGASAAPAGAAFGALAASLGGRSVWATALGLGAVFGLPALGPLLAADAPSLGSAWLWAPAAGMALGLTLLRWRRAPQAS